MSVATEKQIEFQAAVMAEDSSLREDAFTLLDCEDGHHECYGGTVGGAASCYLARMGSDEDRKALVSRLRRDPPALELSRNGLWDESEEAGPLIVELFGLCNEEQRRDTLDILGIVLSENGACDAVVEGFQAAELTASERRWFRRILREAKQA